MRIYARNRSVHYYAKHNYFIIITIIGIGIIRLKRNVWVSINQNEQGKRWIIACESLCIYVCDIKSDELAVKPLNG